MGGNRNKRKMKRKSKDLDSDDEFEVIKSRRLSRDNNPTKLTQMNSGSAEQVDEEFFTRHFWNGEVGEDPPSEALKELRKSLGINVKGKLSLCPHPVLTTASKLLPHEFKIVSDLQGIETPSTVQSQCWPAALAGANILG
jgi:hypothetical protein